MPTPEQVEAAKDKGYWWCPSCFEEVDGVHVTYSELHTVCGHAVVGVTPLDNTDCLVTALRESEAECARLREFEVSPEQLGKEMADEATRLDETTKLRAENARLRKVVDAAKDVRLEWGRGHITVRRHDDGSWPLGTAGIMDRFENALRNVAALEEGHGE